MVRLSNDPYIEEKCKMNRVFLWNVINFERHFVLVSVLEHQPVSTEFYRFGWIGRCWDYIKKTGWLSEERGN